MFKFNVVGVRGTSTGQRLRTSCGEHMEKWRQEWTMGRDQESVESRYGS